MPFLDANINSQSPFASEGRPPPPPDQQSIASVTIATPGYFPVMAVPVLMGRGLAATDTAATEQAAVVNSIFAAREFPGGDPVGRWMTLRFNGALRRVQIVGVVGEVRHDGLDKPARAEIFLPHAQQPFGSMTFVIRTAGDPSRLVEPAKQAVWTRDPLL
jgi:hypothetical protein